ncbi:uncharacterized protein PHACADRAFT_253966 [Phanerochaete carnosa HHB-10118-sp]|uniref:Sugar phosphate transporter domain-containing protein n=1 Tax=Phanerochaete carnosa (strain HHB-10118-sp) TaxID=650164 RepID=K5WBV5_PHACS|nr:uncharacterized protein PHACADRAFT_253966 [Phanerochaete carnosa HHB-10118-sp]EKM56695.1 hypothetical protein PHACADRAFT_253966 [Phanerochaete carnosa HHB-10118-sp]
MDCRQATQTGEGQWLSSPGTHGWASISSPQVQVQALANSSPRLRHAFLRNILSYSPSPTLDLDAFPCRSWKNESHTTQSAPKRGSSSSSQITAVAFASTAASCLARMGWGSQFSWLCLYFAFNLILTLSNKSVLTSFPFPYTLTAIHALCSTAGGLFLRSHSFYIPKQLDLRSELCLAAFSFLYSINIAVSNVSLNLVTVPFHQVIRAITPLLTIALSTFLYGICVRRDRLCSLLPVMFGVALATYGDYYFTLWGLFLTLIGTFLAALKTIYTSALQSSAKRPPPPTSEIPTPATWGRSHHANHHTAHSHILSGLRRFLVPPKLDLHPLDLLTRMSPLAFIQCVVYAQLSGELDRLSRFGISYHEPSVSAQLLNATVMHSQLHLPGNALFNTTTASLDCLHPQQPLRVGGVPLSQVVILLINGCIAFGLNVVSFSANGKVGPLSMTVAANVKQVLTILFAVSLFNLTITTTNAIGISITLLGGAWYAWVEYTSKLNKRGGLQ